MPATGKKIFKVTFYNGIKNIKNKKMRFNKIHKYVLL